MNHSKFFIRMKLSPLQNSGSFTFFYFLLIAGMDLQWLVSLVHFQGFQNFGQFIKIFIAGPDLFSTFQGYSF
jgi:hypothetical protein